MLPLEGRRVVVTRAPHQASELAERLRGLGAEPVFLPTIEIAEPSSYAALDAAIEELERFDLVAFTSANAVEAMGRRAGVVGAELVVRRLAARRVAVVGPATARAVETIGLGVDVMPAVYTAEALAARLAPEVRGRRVLLVLAEDAPRILRAALEASGAAVTVAAAYSNRIPERSREMAAELFAEGAKYPDAVTFTSASTAGNLVALLAAAGLTLPEEVTRASIGPITSRALRELGLAAHVEAAEATVDALVDALAGHIEGGQ
jgi:uroporphyrinogen-III synthase